MTRPRERAQPLPTVTPIRPARTARLCARFASRTNDGAARARAAERSRYAHSIIASAIFAGWHIPVQVLFTPLLAGWSIWVGIAISARSSDVRVAQQLSVLANVPPVAIVALLTFKVITPSTGLALGLAAILLALDALGWRAVAAMFDRERLIAGTRT